MNHAKSTTMLAFIASLLLGACNGGGVSGGFGGAASGSVSGNSAGYWEQLPPSLLERLEAFGGTAGDALYVFGGYVPWDNALSALLPNPSSDIERYDTRTGEWKLMKPMPMHLDHGRAVEYGGDLYVTGGIVLVAVTTPLFWRYDPDEDSWNPMPPMPFPVGAHAAGLVGDKLVVVGGYEMVVDTPFVQVFDFKTGSWSVGPLFPHQVDHVIGTALGDYMYVISGRPNDGMQWAYKDVFRWRPGDAAWERVADLPHPRSGGGAVVACDRIVVAGGEHPTAPDDVVPEVEIYDPTRNVWSALPPMITPRTGVAVMSHGNRVYAVEGPASGEGINSFSNIVERLTLNCAALADLPPAEPYDPPLDGVICSPPETPVFGGQCPPPEISDRLPSDGSEASPP